MKRLSLVFACLAILVGGGGGIAGAGYEGTSIFNLKSGWSTQDGKQVQLSLLQGHPTVLAMVYTSCKGACPMIIADLRRIERELPESARAKVRFAVFSFDPVRDTPARLKEFAKAHDVDLSCWTFFHGNKKSVRDLSAILGIRYKADAEGNIDHSNIISILDSGGSVRHQQIGLRQDPKESIARLIELAR